MRLQFYPSNTEKNIYRSTEYQETTLRSCSLFDPTRIVSNSCSAIGVLKFMYRNDFKKMQRANR